MNTLEIEDRIRAATRAAGDTVTPDSVPALRLPSERPLRSRFRFSFRSSFGFSVGSSFRPGRAVALVWARRLAPLAAAVAVIAVAVAMVTVGRSVNYGAGGKPTASASASASLPFRPGPVRAGPAISAYVASGRVPRYYVSIESHGNPNFNPSYAVVRSTATGAAIDTVMPAASRTVLAVTAAADDKTFILDTAPWVSPSSNANQSFEPRSFVQLTLSSAGGIQSQKGLPQSVPAGQLMTGFALSPDGSKLALAIQPDNNKHQPDLTEVKVVTLATGATVTWTANGTIGTGPDDARALSWTSDDRALAFTWAASGPGVHTGLWILDVAAGGGSLMAHSQEVVTLINQGAPGASPTGQAATQPQCQLDSIITPDGSTLVCGAITPLNEKVNPNGGGLQRGAETAFFEYIAVGGSLKQVLGYWTFGSVGALSVDVLWSDATGSVLIGVIPDSGTGRAGVISGNKFTPLPATAVSGTW
jgi:hypothetical protein